MNLHLSSGCAPLAGHIKEMRDEVTLQQGRATSLEGEMTRAQKLSIEMEGQLVEAQVIEQQDVNELKKDQGRSGCRS